MGTGYIAMDDDDGENELYGPVPERGDLLVTWLFGVCLLLLGVERDRLYIEHRQPSNTLADLLSLPSLYLWTIGAIAVYWWFLFALSLVPLFFPLDFLVHVFLFYLFISFLLFLFGNLWFIGFRGCRVCFEGRPFSTREILFLFCLANKGRRERVFIKRLFSFQIFPPWKILRMYICMYIAYLFWCTEERVVGRRPAIKRAREDRTHVTLLCE